MTYQPFIKKLTVQGFRSFLNEPEVIELANPTFLVGQNGAGKSNIADIFAFLSEAMASPLQAAFARRGGIETVRSRRPGASVPINLGVEISFVISHGVPYSGSYGFVIKPLRSRGFEVVREWCWLVEPGPDGVRFDRHGAKIETNVEYLRPKMDAQALALPVVGGLAEFEPLLTALSAMRVYSIEPARIRDVQDFGGGTSLKRDGSNLASVLEKLERQDPDAVERIGEFLAAIVPGVSKVRPVRHGKQLALEFTQDWSERRKVRFEAQAMSDGTLRALGMLTAVMQEPTPSLIVIEELEASLHPGALGAVLDLIQIAAHRTQVVITTQSPDVLDAKWVRADNLRIVTWERGATHVLPVSQSIASALREHLMGAGELLRSNALDAGPKGSDVSSSELFAAAR